MALKKLGWRKVGALTQDGAKYSDYMSTLQVGFSVFNVAAREITGIKTLTKKPYYDGRPVPIFYHTRNLMTDLYLQIHKARYLPNYHINPLSNIRFHKNCNYLKITTLYI